MNCRDIYNFKVILTLDGNENSYTRYIVKKYSHLKNIEFIGIQPRENIFELYRKCSCLLFPSKLESWGLPISEFKFTGKPILMANLNYAYETVGCYDNCDFFDPDNPLNLSELMHKVILGSVLRVIHRFQLKNLMLIPGRIFLKMCYSNF